MPPSGLYLENILPSLIQGIQELEADRIPIRYQKKVPLEHGNQQVIFGMFYLSLVQIPLSSPRFKMDDPRDINCLPPGINLMRDKETTPNHLTHADEDNIHYSGVASGATPTIKLLSSQAVDLREQVQCKQYLPHLQEHALDVKKYAVTNAQEHQNELSQRPKISKKLDDKLVLDDINDHGARMFMLSKAETLGMKWLELVRNALANPETTETLTTLAELKSVLIEYTSMIDKILMGYAQQAEGNPNFPDQSGVISTNNKLKAIVSKLNPADIKAIFPERIVVTEEDFLCALLGLDSEVAGHLKNMPEEFRQHEPDEYYIKSYIEEKMDYADKGSERDVKTCCEQCGFTCARAERIARRLKKFPLTNHQSLSLWLERYVDDMFRYVVHLSGKSPRYPHKETVVDKWIPVESTRYAEDDDGYPQPENISVNVMNSPSREREKKYIDMNRSRKYWYHGTDHASALSILEEGIQPRRGRAMQDFSDGDGFYLSSHFKEAKMWAHAWSRPAVILFNKKSVAHQKFKGLNLCFNNETRWAQIVKYNRCGRSRKCLPEKDLREAFDESDYVMGPRSTDGRKGTPENESYLTWQPLGYEEGCQQLCIKSKEMADAVGEVDNIEGVIFY